ncbi:hypothetical protein JTB14_014455 [Gonioctena quinquepunctata]|nr:hypothetical protein JTB14_014455 [Gonioctena quinquepunctata]
MDGIEGRLANEVSRSGEFYSLDECLQEAEQCEEVVSRMVHETRYDARISAIRRVETREEVPYRREGRDGAMENRSETRNYQRNERRGGRNPQGGPRDNGANRFPYMRTRCLRCGEEGHRAIGCRRPRKMFCYHCGKEGAPCSLNSQRPSDQPTVKKLEVAPKRCHMPYQPQPFQVHRPIHFPDSNNMAPGYWSFRVIDKEETGQGIEYADTPRIDVDHYRHLRKCTQQRRISESNLSTSERSIEHDCIVCDDGLSFPSDGLLGVDFLNKFRPTLDFQKNLLILQGYSLVMSDDHLIPSHRTIDTNSPVVRKVPIDVETRQLFSVGKQMCDNVECKLCIGTADSTPQENVGTIDHGIEENGPVESHTLASGLVCKPTGDMRIDLSLSNRSGEFNIASISDNSPKERTDNQTSGIAAADDKGRRNAVPSAGKDNNLKGPSLVRLQHQVYIPPFHGCDFDVPVDIRNSKGVKTINKHTPILTLADVTVLEGQDIPVTKNTIAQVEFNLQHMELVKHRFDIGDSAPVYLRGVNARIEEIHGRKEQLVHVNRLKRCLATEDPRDQLGNVATRFRTHNREPPRRAEVQTVSGAGLQVARGNKKAGGWGINKSVSASTGEANRSSQGGDCNNGPPEDFEGPITRTQRMEGPPERRANGNLGLQIVRRGTPGATAQFLSTHGYGRAESRTGGVLVLSCSIVWSSRRRAVPDYGTEFGDGWRGLFTPACWNQEGGGLLRGAEQLRGPQADLKEEEYLPNPISHQGRSPVSKDLVVFKH